MKIRKVDIEDGILYWGETKDIKALYKSFTRALNKYKTDVYPLFCNFPTFSENKKIYGLTINSENQMVVVNSESVMEMLIENNLI